MTRDEAGPKRLRAQRLRAARLRGAQLRGEPGAISTRAVGGGGKHVFLGGKIVFLCGKTWDFR